MGTLAHVGVPPMPMHAWVCEDHAIACAGMRPIACAGMRPIPMHVVVRNALTLAMQPMRT